MRWWEPLSNLHNEPRPAGSGSHSSPNEARPGGSAPGRNHRDTDRRTTAPNPNEPRPAGSGQSEPISPEPLLPGRGSCVRLRNEHLYGARIRPLLGPLWWMTWAKLLKVLFCPEFSCKMPGLMIAAESVCRRRWVERACAEKRAGVQQWCRGRACATCSNRCVFDRVRERVSVGRSREH